jgi:hypothetical protein
MTEAAVLDIPRRATTAGAGADESSVRVRRAAAKLSLWALCAVAVLAPGAATGLGATLGSAGPAAAQVQTLTPGRFAEYSTGIALVRIFNCEGSWTAEGTGFLIGSGVVMTARHVLRGACHVKVFIDGSWRTVNSWTSWSSRNRDDIGTADIATIRLHGTVPGHVFPIRSWSPAVGVNLAALGHPLGNEISLTQGQVIEKGRFAGTPILAVRLLGAEGASGSPLVDDSGNVVGILQRGLGGADALGQHTAGLILGIDLSSWWPTAKDDLCIAYAEGGVPGCGAAAAKPSTHYTAGSCWIQYTAGLQANVSSGSALPSLAVADLLARGLGNFWAVTSLSAPATAPINGVTVTLTAPNGSLFASAPVVVPAGSSTAHTSMDWRFSDGSRFVEQPATTPIAGTWTVHWTFPNGAQCSTPFTVI